MKLNNTIHHLILTLLPVFVLSGCLGTEYYDVATDEIITPEGITNVIPQEGAANERQKVGNLYLSPYGELHICLHNHSITGYDSEIGFCSPDYKDALKKLYPGWHGYVQSEMTLFLEEPAN